MRCAYNKNKGDGRLMQHALRAIIQPPIQCEVVDDEMIWCYHYKNEGDDKSMRCTPRASQPPI
eukprot:14658723-Ditylum_brightwellii.AAC.1